MTIRFAKSTDIAALVAFGARIQPLTRFASFGYDEKRVAGLLAAVLHKASPRHGCLVAEDAKGDIVGLLFAVLEKHVFSDAVVSSVMHFAVLPESRMGGYGVRLLRAFEEWSANRQVREIQFGITSQLEMEQVAKFARRMGYVKVGEHFIKSVG